MLEDQGKVQIGRPPFSLEKWLFTVLSTHWCGNDIVPLDHDTLYFKNHGCDYVASFLSDSFEIGIGYPDRWHVLLRRDAVHQVIRWYLWKWIWGEWFGLRRYLWYRLLDRRVRKYKFIGSINA